MTTPTPFHDLDECIALPRLEGLSLSPDGTRLVAAMNVLDPKRTRYVTALWEVDPQGERAARRLTRSAKGENEAAFLSDGSLLFVSARPDPAGSEDEPVSALWRLPAGSGEAGVVATRPGGVGGVVVARDSGTIVVSSDTLPGSTTAEDDHQRRSARKDNKVSAILHETYPIRFWDHDLGPDTPRLMVGEAPGDEVETIELRDLTGHVGTALCTDEASWSVSPDGRTVYAGWSVVERGGSDRLGIIAIDTGSGRRVELLSDADHEYSMPAVSPDGSHLAFVTTTRPTSSDPPDMHLAIVELSGDGMSAADVQIVAADWDRWPGQPVWVPDGSALVVAADSDGCAPLFRVDLDGRVTRLTADHGAYSSVCIDPEGQWVYAMRSAIDAPSAPVRIASAGAGQQPTMLRGPAPVPPLPGSLTDVSATAADGAIVRAWLVLPDGASEASPAPLLLWIHGGPLASWNAWSWRWNPWVMAAAGYAVLLPDPAISTGYGRAFIARGWGAWGAAPYTDLMAITDAVEQRADIDATRTAAMGGSFGGYMANWVATHTDRFKGIITHASLWALEQFGPTTDSYHYWRREISAAMIAANSPHHFVEQITTPMLVIHGEKDFRIPYSQSLAMFNALQRRNVPSRLVMFPDENHWILKPQNSRLWYREFEAWLGRFAKPGARKRG
ncbi:MAG: S9 family peptidase [Actinomycetota bacterium]|nr:S9 family peptidase [Actinomycetota bacterium]